MMLWGIFQSNTICVVTCDSWSVRLSAPPRTPINKPAESIDRSMKKASHQPQEEMTGWDGTVQPTNHKSQKHREANIKWGRIDLGRTRPWQDHIEQYSIVYCQLPQTLSLIYYFSPETQEKNHRRGQVKYPFGIWSKQALRLSIRDNANFQRLFWLIRDKNDLRSIWNGQEFIRKWINSQRMKTFRECVIFVLFGDNHKEDLLGSTRDPI